MLALSSKQALGPAKANIKREPRTPHRFLIYTIISSKDNYFKMQINP